MPLLPSVSRALVLALLLCAGSGGCKRQAPAMTPEPPGVNLYVGCANSTGDIRRYRLVYRPSRNATSWATMFAIHALNLVTQIDTGDFAAEIRWLL